MLLSFVLIFSDNWPAYVLNENLLKDSALISKDGPILNPDFDAIALEYCVHHKNSYVAIVWPRAIDQIDLIKRMLGSCGRLLYEKHFELKNNAPVLFFQMIHPEIFGNAIKPKLTGKYNDVFMKNYIPHYLSPPYKFCVILFDTKKTAAEVIDCKHAIRRALKISFFSIHINDSYLESIAAANVVFNNAKITTINADLKRALGLFQFFAESFLQKLHENIIWD